VTAVNAVLAANGDGIQSPVKIDTTALDGSGSARPAAPRSSKRSPLAASRPR
jgi:hypothetical protein